MTKDEILQYEPPAARLLGREVLEIDEVNGGAVLRYTAQPEFLNRHGTVQGGMLAAMLDSATALALYAVLPPELTGVTTNLNVSYLKPARLVRVHRNDETHPARRAQCGSLRRTARR